MSKEYKIVDFTESIKDLTKLLKDTHHVRKRNGIVEYNYTGSQEIEHHSITSCINNIKDSFIKDNLEYELERGRDILTVVLSCAFRLGYSSAMINRDNESDVDYKELLKKLQEKSI